KAALSEYPIKPDEAAFSTGQERAPRGQHWQAHVAIAIPVAGRSGMRGDGISGIGNVPVGRGLLSALLCALVACFCLSLAVADEDSTAPDPPVPAHAEVRSEAEEESDFVATDSANTAAPAADDVEEPSEPMISEADDGEAPPSVLAE